MSITAIFVLVGIILAFIVFALVLAWGEYQTRNISKSGRQQAETAGNFDQREIAKNQVDPRNGSSNNSPWLVAGDGAKNR